MTQIVPYTPAHAGAFCTLNETWIRQYFELEEADIRALHHPDEYILQKGGHILMAEQAGVAVGTCALLKMDDPHYDYELAKMVVSPAVQGQGIGKALMQAAMDLARQLGAKALYLESNRRLGPAIRLYHQVGFVEVEGRPSPYARCDIQMVCYL